MLVSAFAGGMVSLFPASLLFYGGMGVGTTLSVSASTWGMVWCGLEVNLFSFLPLMVMGKGGSSVEGAGKYFIVQVCGSIIFLFAPVVSDIGMSAGVLGGGLLVKLGSVPAHFWFPTVMAGLGWFFSYLLMTWQKLAPLVLGSGLVGVSGSAILLFLAGCNSVVGAVGGFSQTHLRPLFGYSSINQLGWLLSLMVVSKSGVILYWGVYSLLLLPIFILLLESCVFSIKAMGVMGELGGQVLLLWGVLVLSVSGMPPFGGFFLKGYTLSFLVGSGFSGVGVILVVGSVVTLAFYLNLVMLGLVCGVSVGRVGGPMMRGKMMAIFSVSSIVGVPVFMGMCLL